MSRRLWNLESQSLCAAARRRTGLEDFGEPPIEPALSILVKSLDQEADLNPLGRFLIWTHLRDLLEVRLRLVKEWSGKRAALDDTPIEKPVFITGMPRSGSTFLHELLAQDPQNRAPQAWEVMFPVPAAQADPSRHAPWIRKAATRLWWFRQLAPRADSVHPLRACTPQECVAIHSYTLLSEEFLSTCHIPGYEAFLHATALGPAYAWQKRFLQYLQLSCPGKRWLLKSPDHVYGLAELFSVFPDAVVIQTHRHPLEVIRSCSQLIEVLQGLFSRSVDRDQIRRREARILAEAMERFLQFRDGHRELADRFIDIKYTELVAEPLAAVRRIYQCLGRPLSEAAAERMRCFASKRSRYSGRRATGIEADAGFDVIEEARRFDRYCGRFAIPCQQTEPS